MDMTKIITMLDYFIRVINDLLNQLLGMLGLSELTSNSVEFSTTRDVLNPNPQDGVLR